MRAIAAATYGDDDAAGVMKRIGVVLVWLLGVAIIAELTASITSFQTIDRLQSAIRGPDDLPGKTIASVRGTAAADYLTAQGLAYTPIASASEAFELLQHGELQAVVFDAPALEYWAAKQGHGIVEVVGPLFRPRNMRWRSPMEARCGNGSTRHCSRSTRTEPTTRSTRRGSPAGDRDSSWVSGHPEALNGAKQRNDPAPTAAELPRTLDALQAVS
jgi:hypothetical protein